LFRKLRRLVNTCLGRDLICSSDIHVRTERLGSEYGGWNIATDKIDASSVVYSFGIGEDVSFDVAMIERFGLTVHAFDPTPKSLKWLETQPLPRNFVLHEYGVAAFDGMASFHPPDNANHVSHTILERESTKHQAIHVPVKRVGTIMGELGHERVDLLKMDIEGAEYQVIEDLCNSNVRPGQVLVEFHHRFPNVTVKATKDAIAQLRSMGYLLFFVSASGREFCFMHGPSLS